MDHRLELIEDSVVAFSLGEARIKLLDTISIFRLFYLASVSGYAKCSRRKGRRQVS
jgi:hypothetical protein